MRKGLKKVEQLKDKVIEASKGFAEAIRDDGMIPTFRVLCNVGAFLEAERDLRQWVRKQK